MTTITIKENTPFDATEFDSVKDFLLAWLLYEKHGSLPTEFGPLERELTVEEQEACVDISDCSVNSLHNL